MRNYFLREDPQAAKAERDARFRAFFAESLADYLGQPSFDAGREFAFRRGPHGKPYFADEALAGVYFSISDTTGCRAVCFSDREVGVDCENVPARARMGEEGIEKIARRWFSEEEQAFVAGDAHGGAPAVPDSEGMSAAERFFWVWTRKEAYVKWTGDGIFSGMRAFSTLGDERIVSGLFEEEIRWAICSEKQTA
ncbi:MAG: 4'-phosphopantetheinyl transferase superfamily protein [Clostridiales Family XIII bacterium]|nr:4'-phosphopantetheinyl transferase superfamily protein [Clostridiales Family XIII bacterium]